MGNFMINFEITLDDLFTASWADDEQIIEAICDYCANKDSTKFYANLLFDLFNEVNLSAINEDYPELYEKLIAVIDERKSEIE